MSIRRTAMRTIRLCCATLWLTFGIEAMQGAEPATLAEERIAKTRSELLHADATVRRAAIGSLIHSDISSRLQTEMRAALKDQDGEVRSMAATAIGNLGKEAVPALPELIAQLQKDKVKEARETAARALGRIGKAAPDETLPVAPLKAACKDDQDPVTRVVSHGALAMLEIDLAGQITDLRGYLHHEEALVRMKAAHALGMIGAPARAAGPEIVEVLQRETDGHRRGYVARALGSTGDPSSLPALLTALEKETDPGSQGEIRGAISRLGGKVPEKK